MCGGAEMPEDRTHWPELGLGALDPGIDPTSQLMGVLRARLKPEGASKIHSLGLSHAA